MDHETQTCPFCATEMPAIAIVCPSCNARKGYFSAGRITQTPWGMRFVGIKALLGCGLVGIFVVMFGAYTWIGWSSFGLGFLIFSLELYSASLPPAWHR
ncbi:MAG: hypothetical protein JKY31_13185 [Rhodobacteraceae bacterium]|nr:hypothetical protein [Paracoccaceae bacterium]